MKSVFALKATGTIGVTDRQSLKYLGKKQQKEGDDVHSSGQFFRDENAETPVKGTHTLILSMNLFFFFNL